MTRVAKWVQDLTDEVLGRSDIEVGKIMRHPDGRKVKIISGSYWGMYGLSNFWYWREVKLDGRLGKKECGYGW